MEVTKRISVSLPDSLLSELDAVAQSHHHTRSELVIEAAKSYLKERRRLELKEQMKNGYLEMGELNLAIAKDCFEADENTSRNYERLLAECE